MMHFGVLYYLYECEKACMFVRGARVHEPITILTYACSNMVANDPLIEEYTMPPALCNE